MMKQILLFLFAINSSYGGDSAPNLPFRKPAEFPFKQVSIPVKDRSYPGLPGLGTAKLTLDLCKALAADTKKAYAPFQNIKKPSTLYPRPIVFMFEGAAMYNVKKYLKFIYPKDKDKIEDNHSGHLIAGDAIGLEAVYVLRGENLRGNYDLLYFPKFADGSLLQWEDTTIPCWENFKDLGVYYKDPKSETVTWEKPNLVITGYSHGGAAAIKLANEFAEKNVQVSHLITLDAVQRGLKHSEKFEDPIPSNVANYLGFYQTMDTESLKDLIGGIRGSAPSKAKDPKKTKMSVHEINLLKNYDGENYTARELKLRTKWGHGEILKNPFVWVEINKALRNSLLPPEAKVVEPEKKK